MKTRNVYWTLTLGLMGLSMTACAGAAGNDPSPDDTAQATAAETAGSAAPSAAPTDDGDDAKGEHHRHHGPPDPARFVKRFDANGDGALQLAELPPRMGEWLADADTNKDGTLSLDELKAHHEAMKGKFFAKMDKNGDGAITADEVGERHWAHLSAADADKNGSVTQAELEQARANGTLKPHWGHGKHRHRGQPGDAPSDQGDMPKDPAAAPT